MPRLRVLLSVLSFLCASSFAISQLTQQSVELTGARLEDASSAKVSSPNGQITLLLFDAAASANGGLTATPKGDTPSDLRYAVLFHGTPMLLPAGLGLEIEGQAPLGPGMRKTSEQPESTDETYTIPVGKTREVRDHYNGVRVDFQDANGRKMAIEVRAFDDGVAFRYVVPDQPVFETSTHSA